MAEYGLLQEIQVQVRATSIAVAASVSDTFLLVDNGGDFDADDGGTLALNGSQLEYTGVEWGAGDEDPDTILLAEPLAVAAEVDDMVAVMVGTQVAEDWWAVVDMGAGDPVMVGPLTFTQRSVWVPGIYDPPLPVMVSEDLSRIEDAPGSSPGGRTLFRNTDLFVATGPGDMPCSLSYVPTDGSVHVYWNGLLQPPSEWALVGNLLTLLDPDDVIVAADEVSVAYAYDGGGSTPPAPVVTPLFRDAAPQQLNGWTIPDDAEVGDLLLALAMMPSSESVNNLNGWTPAGVSEYVTHTAVGGGGGGTRTYRLEAYYFINDGSTVLTCSALAAQDVVCSMVAFANGASVDAIFDTLDDGTSADAPASSPVSLRAWGTIGDTVTITPGRGSVVLNTNYVEIDTALTIDPDPTPAPATTSGSAGWCLASLVVRA